MLKLPIFNTAKKSIISISTHKFYTPAYTNRVYLPIASTRIEAGFPSPANDHIEQ